MDEGAREQGTKKARCAYVFRLDLGRPHRYGPPAFIGQFEGASGAAVALARGTRSPPAWPHLSFRGKKEFPMGKLAGMTWAGVCVGLATLSGCESCSSCRNNASSLPVANAPLPPSAATTASSGWNTQPRTSSSSSTFDPGVAPASGARPMGTSPTYPSQGMGSGSTYTPSSPTTNSAMPSAPPTQARDLMPSSSYGVPTFPTAPTATTPSSGPVPSIPLPDASSGGTTSYQTRYPSPPPTPSTVPTMPPPGSSRDQ